MFGWTHWNTGWLKHRLSFSRTRPHQLWRINGNYYFVQNKQLGRWPYLCNGSLVPSPCAPPSEKWSGERNWICWVCCSKVVRTNEIERSVLVHSTSLKTLKQWNLFISIWVSVPFLKGLSATKCCTVTKACASPRNLIWFTRPFLAGKCTWAGAQDYHYTNKPEA